MRVIGTAQESFRILCRGMPRPCYESVISSESGVADPDKSQEGSVAGGNQRFEAFELGGKSGPLQAENAGRRFLIALSAL